MKHNIRLTPEQKVVQAAIKWYRASKNKFNAEAEKAFVKVIVRHDKTVNERVRLNRYDVDSKNYHALTEEEKSILECTHAWFDVSTGECEGDIDEHRLGLQGAIINLFEHQKKEKQDAIVGCDYYNVKRDGLSELMKWCGRMTRKGARYFGSCWSGCGAGEFVLASKLPITSRDVEKENKTHLG